MPEAVHDTVLNLSSTVRLRFPMTFIILRAMDDETSPSRN